jgi:hypothetical protein
MSQCLSAPSERRWPADPNAGIILRSHIARPIAEPAFRVETLARDAYSTSSLKGGNSI